MQVNSTGIPDTHPDNVKGFIFNDPIVTANEYLFLRDSCDVFVMLNHFGFEEDVILANQLPTGVVDLIIGGHSHTKVDTDQIHNGVMITQAQRRLNYATLIKLTINPDGNFERNGSAIPSEIKVTLDPISKQWLITYKHNPAMTKL